MTVLIAGATGGLGPAVVAELESSGYEVATPRVDLTDTAAATGAVEGVEGLEAVVNLVGGFASGPKVHETDPAEFERMLRLNLFTGFNLARAAMPLLVERGGGAYVGVSARHVSRPFPGAAGYISAKAAVLAFVQALDADYKADGVRANCIVPATIDTPANRAAMPNADHSKWVATKDIAKVVRFLVSDDSKPVSGAAIPVYGLA